MRSGPSACATDLGPYANWSMDVASSDGAVARLPVGLETDITFRDELMRIQHSLKALGSALALLTAVSVASAQSDPSGQRWVNAYGESVDLNAPPPDYSPYAPPSAPPGYGPAPGSSQVPTLAPPGVPQSMAPWPAISPFQNPQIAIDQHVQQDGLWFREAIYRDRDWEASVEYIYSQYREPHGARIGSRMGKISNTQTDAGVMPLQGPPRRVYGQAVQSPLNEIVVGPGAYPFPGLLVGTNIVFIE